MPVRDLREWIDRVDAMGELTRVDGADASTELGNLTDLFQWDMGNPPCCSIASSATRPVSACSRP